MKDEDKADYRRAFKEGQERAKLTSHKQALIRAAFDAVSIVLFFIYVFDGPGIWWLRLILGLAGLAIYRFIYGLFASSDKFHKWL